MKKIDYIIVGCGLAGIAFAEKLRKENKSFVVFDNSSQESSKVAAGLYNPVILKRFTKVWQSHEQLAYAKSFYGDIEQYLNIKIDHQLPILRIFHSIEEQNKWFEACDKPFVREFLKTTIIKLQIDGIKAPFGFGEVTQTGRISTSKLVLAYKEHLKEQGKLIDHQFDYTSLKTNNDSVLYQDIEAKHIVYSEGFGLKKNPFFSNLPLRGNKGELLTIKCPELSLDVIVKAGVFIIPLGEQCFRVGSTYNREYTSATPSKEARKELEEKLQSILDYDYEIVAHQAAIRPTVKDRRPLVGRHHEFKYIYVLNGFGSRGVMIAPLMAEKLYQLIEKDIPLENEVDCNRFEY